MPPPRKDDVARVYRVLENLGLVVKNNKHPLYLLWESGFADGRSKASPDSEQIEQAVAKPQMRNSVSVEQIQDREKFVNERSEFTNLGEGKTLSQIARIRSRSLSNSTLSRGERTVPSLGGGGLRAEGELLWQNGKAIAGTKRRPVKREQPSRCHEMTGEGSTSFAKQTDTNLQSYRPNVLTTSNKLDCFATARNDEKTLVPQYLSALVPSKKVAFTLAEVLITLGIIGVVAAMTMPLLQTAYKKKVTETKLKKFYSVINTALRRSIAENDDISFHIDTMTDFGVQEKTWLETNIIPYINVKFNGEVLPTGKSAFKASFPDGTGFISSLALDADPTIMFTFCLNMKNCEPK